MNKNNRQTVFRSFQLVLISQDYQVHICCYEFILLAKIHSLTDSIDHVGKKYTNETRIKIINKIYPCLKIHLYN